MARADQSGDFSYTSDGTSVTITGYQGSGGDVSIPATIGGLPVTGIARWACANTGITRLKIPAGIVSIGGNLLQGSTSTSEIVVAAGNPNYSSVDGVLFNKGRTILIQYPPGKTGTYSIPSTVTNIGSFAFEDSHVRVLTFPVSVTYIGDFSFSGSSGLESMIFLGGAPALGFSPFHFNSYPTIYCYSGSTGFTPFWMGVQTEFIDQEPVVVAPLERATISTGGSATFTVMALGPGPLTYWWYQGSPGNTSSPVGSNSPTFTTPPLYSNTSYWVAVRNSTQIPMWGDASTSVTVLPRPIVTTGTSSGVTATSATLLGTVNPKGFVESVRFDYGLTAAYGSTMVVGIYPKNGTSPLNVSSLFTGLRPGTTYHYRLSAMRSDGPTSGGDMTFTTLNMSAGDWLQSQGLPADANLQADPDGDGVSLLMAYALNLDPGQNLSSSLPKPTLNPNQLTLRFYGGSPSVTYQVETSTDLVNWTTAGVGVSAPDSNQVRTATVAASGAQRYMRLVVSH